MPTPAQTRTVAMDFVKPLANRRIAANAFLPGRVMTAQTHVITFALETGHTIASPIRLILVSVMHMVAVRTETTLTMVVFVVMLAVILVVLLHARTPMVIANSLGSARLKLRSVLTSLLVRKEVSVTVSLGGYVMLRVNVLSNHLP